MDNGLRSSITRLRALIEPWIFRSVAPTPDAWERRAATRYRLVKPVGICASGAGLGTLVTMMNVSLTGAAVRIPEKALNGWLLELSQGDEVSLSGLVSIPVDCWVVALDRDMLRVRFLPTPVVELQLQDLIGHLAIASPGSGPLSSDTGKRQIRKGFAVAAGILLIAPGFLTWTYVIPPARPDRRPQLPGVRATKQPDATAFSQSAAGPVRLDNQLVPHSHAAAVDATQSPPSELPPLTPSEAPESPPLFLLAAGSEFTARIDSTTGSNGGTISAIVESNIYDTRTNHLVLPRGTRLSG
jgi:PilZ domain